MARDLHDAENLGGADVDVLLPIGGRSAPTPAPEGTIVLRPEFNDGEPLSLDLDLTTDAGDNLDPPLGGPSADFSLVKTDKETPPTPEADFWGDNPDARPTR
jgi:hypothetical protein